MADLEVEPSDLSTYLGTDVDEDRAELLIALAVDLCGAIVSPVPEAAKAVVLSATARAYVNPQGVTSELTGPFQVSRPSAGVYLTRPERATLRRLSGGGGAFSVDLLHGYPDDRFEDDETITDPF